MITADVLVLGAGTAGCVAAAEAVRAGLTVVLAEAGPDYGRRDAGGWPADLLEPWTLPDSHDWGLTEELPGGRVLALARGKVVGGSSSVNGCVATWGDRADYDGWRDDFGLAGWDADTMRAHLAAVSRDLAVRPAAPEEVTPFQRGCLDAALELGLPFLPDVNDLDAGAGAGTLPSTTGPSTTGPGTKGPGAAGPGATGPGTTGGRQRHNAAFAFLDPVRGSRGLTILAGHLADRLTVSGGRVTGAWLAGPSGPLACSAGLVVLAAGVYGSPAVLLRSGVGPAAGLAAGIRPVLPLEGVGANLHDQPTVDVRFAGSAGLARAMSAWLGAAGVADQPVLVKARSTAAGPAPDLHVFPVAETPFEGRPWGWVLPVACLDPRSRGRLALRSADPAAPPVIRHGFLTDADGHDLRVLLDGIALARQLAARPALRMLGPEVSPALDGPALARWVRAGHGIYWHPAGTCRMGPAADPAAVTDAAGRVHGLAGCVVADASVMPAVPRANTNIPVAAVARKISRTALGG